MTRKINLLVGGVAILCFSALVFVPWGEEKIAPEVLEEVEIECAEGDVLKEGVCIVSNPQPIYANENLWFYSFFDWLGGLFK